MEIMDRQTVGIIFVFLAVVNYGVVYYYKIRNKKRNYTPTYPYFLASIIAAKIVSGFFLILGLLMIILGR